MSIGSVLDEAWTLFTRFFMRFFLIALVVFAAINLVYALLVAAISSDNDGRGASPRARRARDRGHRRDLAPGRVRLRRPGRSRRQLRRVDRRDLLARLARRSCRCCSPACSPVSASPCGFLLLIVPGLFLITIWSVIAPVIVVEKTRVLEAFGRSRELVRGHGWTVFGIVIITALLSGIASALLQAAFSWLPEFFEILSARRSPRPSSRPFGAIAIAVMYFRLRETHSEVAAPVEA